MKSLIISTATCLLLGTTVVSAHTFTPDNIVVTFTHNGPYCFTFEVDKLPGVRFAVPVSPVIVDINTGESITPLPNATGMQNDVLNHAVTGKPLLHFAYDETVMTSCGDRGGFLVKRDMDSNFTPRK